MRIKNHLLCFVLANGLALSCNAATHASHSPHQHRPKHQSHSILSSQPSVDLNTAQAKELARQMKGIGKHRAEAIVAYRDVHGRFSSVDDLINVKGISRRMLAKYADDWRKALKID